MSKKSKYSKFGYSYTLMIAFRRYSTRYSGTLENVKIAACKLFEEKEKIKTLTFPPIHNKLYSFL